MARRSCLRPTPGQVRRRQARCEPGVRPRASGSIGRAWARPCWSRWPPAWHRPCTAARSTPSFAPIVAGTTSVMRGPCIAGEW